MAIVWEISSWTWVAVGAISLLGCIAIVRAVSFAIRSVKELADSIALSGKLLNDSVGLAMQEIEHASGRIPNFGSKQAPEPPEWKAW